MSTTENVRTMQFIVKVSKYCNLRCTYCYELRELGNKARMPLDSLRRMFDNAAEYASAHGITSVSFIWHGGEPFLVPLDYYEEIHRQQKEAFGAGIGFWNTVQTNLTVLTDRHVAALKERRLFLGLGVSFDVFGDRRVDTRGESRDRTVLTNMQTLIDNRIPFGAISVLGRHTLNHALDIYRFYDRLGIQSRLLPFYMSASDKQISEHALTANEITSALKSVFDAWLCSDRATPVDPLNEYLDYALSFINSGPRRAFDMAEDEFVYMVNLDGGTWGISDAYDVPYRYGNVFDEPLRELLSSPGRRRTLQESGERMRAHCTGCPFFGHCPGYFVGEATPEQRRLLDEEGCPVKEVIGHMVDRLESAGIDAGSAPVTRRSVGDAMVPG